MGLALGLAVAPSQAEPIRVTTWNLQPGVIAGTNASSINFQHGLVQDAAERLKPLRPDIILLQQVADWETCHQLAQALQPENYQVAICSCFRDPRGKLLRRQVAVLSKAKAFLAWAEPWKKSGALPAPPGGFAFAAIQLGNRNVGIFSVQFSDGDASSADESRSAQWQEARAESARQLVQQITLLQSWKNNRLQSFIVAGDFNTTPDDSRLAHEKTLSLLEQAGFDNAFAGLPLEKRATLPGDARRSAATLDYIFTRDAGVVGPALTTPSPLWEHASVTCEMDLAARKPAPTPPPQIASKTSPTPPPAASPKPAPAPTLLAVSNALATSPPSAVSNAVAKPSPSPASNSAPASPLLVTSNSSTAPPKLAARAELPPVKNTSNPTNLAHAPVAPASATTTSASPQAVLWLGSFLAAGLALFFLARKLVQHAAPEAFPAATADPKSRTGSSITLAQSEPIILAETPDNLPYARMKTEDRSRLPSPVWRPRDDAVRLTDRMEPGVRAGVIANLSRWLKEKAVRRLVSDRARLLATQQTAELTVLAVDQRLAKIERQMQQINQDYERRIDDLLKELIAAKEENRELIHAKISLVKAEMEKARLRAGQRAREHQQY